ncbi:hypothetical protein ACFP56_14855 [Paenibacillus septentrionalis]|uniref:SMI1/KNR4 family protein n=1 Tax=Paenibacillus septentrionalis TaxID=429342 RepID=A0ABW1V8Y7_9BACL
MIEVQNKSHTLKKAEFIFIFTLLGGKELPRDIFNFEQISQYSNEMITSGKNLERQGILSIGFDGIAHVRANIQQCVNTFICRESYYLIKWDHNDGTEGSCCYFINGEDYCEMSISSDGNHYELRMLSGIHVLVSRLFERFADCLLCEDDAIRAVWIAHFTQLNDEWNAKKQFFAGVHEGELWLSDTGSEAAESIVSTTLSQILNSLDEWMFDLYSTIGGNGDG